MARLSTVDGSCTRGASIVTLPPVVALLRRALTHDSDFDGYVARIGNKRLSPVRIGKAPASTSESPYKARSEEHTSELQSLRSRSYAVFCLQKKDQTNKQLNKRPNTATHI